MFVKGVVVSILSFFATLAFASNCLLEDALKHPNTSTNNKFWEEYAALADAENTGALQALLKKYDALEDTSSASKVTTPTTSSFKKSVALEYDRKAMKEIESLPANLKGKVDEFVDATIKPGGILEIRNNPGRWHLEKLPEFGKQAYSVRLNGGYRILFDMDDTKLNIRRVNKGQIHGD